MTHPQSETNEPRAVSDEDRNAPKAVCPTCGTTHVGPSAQALLNRRPSAVTPPGDAVEAVARAIEPQGWAWYDRTAELKLPSGRDADAIKESRASFHRAQMRKAQDAIAAYITSQPKGEPNHGKD